MLLHCGPVRGCFLDDNHVATHRTRDLLHCEFGLYWVFGQYQKYVARSLRLFVRGFGQALQQCLQCRNHRAHDRIRRMAAGRGESVVSYLKDPGTRIKDGGFPWHVKGKHWSANNEDQIEILQRLGQALRNRRKESGEQPVILGKA